MAEHATKKPNSSNAEPVEIGVMIFFAAAAAALVLWLAFGMPDIAKWVILGGLVSSTLLDLLVMRSKYARNPTHLIQISGDPEYFIVYLKIGQRYISICLFVCFTLDYVTCPLGKLLVLVHVLKP